MAAKPDFLDCPGHLRLPGQRPQWFGKFVETTGAAIQYPQRFRSFVCGNSRRKENPPWTEESVQGGLR